MGLTNPLGVEFELAQVIRRSHCDRAGTHECVGEVTIGRGEVRLNCVLCGKGELVPGWDSFAAAKLAMIFTAAGIQWDALDITAKVAAVAKYSELLSK
jgi:hypothetical protein